MNVKSSTRGQSQDCFTRPRGVLLQRKCACGQHTTGGECHDCKKKHDKLQRYPASSLNANAVPLIVHEVLRSPGEPLDEKTRGLMESRFGHDFSRVRVHTDLHAAQSARAVHALAYTVGRNLVFESGQYSPGTARGTALLAHELTHVVQQSRVSPASDQLSIAPENDPSEREADAASDLFHISERHVTPASSAVSVRVGQHTPCLSRQPQDEPKKTTKPLIPIPVFDQLDVKPIVPGVDLPSMEDVHKKAAEVFGGNKPEPGKANCSAYAGFKAAGSDQFKGQCCKGGESKETCCFPKQIQTGPFGDKCVRPTRDKAEPPEGEVNLSKDFYPNLGIGKLRPSPSFLSSVGSAVVDGFDLDKADLSERNQMLVDFHAKVVARLFQMDPDARVEIVGHTDATGKEQHNENLGSKRANAARLAMAAAGVPLEKVTVRSAGSSEPVEKTPGKEPRNRRVEIRFLPSISQGKGGQPKTTPSPVSPLSPGQGGNL